LIVLVNNNLHDKMVRPAGLELMIYLIELFVNYLCGNWFLPHYLP